MQSQETQLETFRKAIESSPSHLVEQFILLHSNYLDAAAADPKAAYEKYSTKIAAIQGLCAAALAHKVTTAHGGRPMRHRKTKKKRRQNRWPVS